MNNHNEESTMTPKSSGRKRYRVAYSCTECTRRKLRCSKEIPCSGCIERGIAHECQRYSQEDDPAPTRKRARLIQQEQSQESSPPLAGRTSSIVAGSNTIEVDQSPSRPQRNAVDGVGQDTAVTLEFLALSRRQVLQDANLDDQSPAIESPADNGVEMLFAAQQVNQMMVYHEACLAWTHNVVHMPTFRAQCETRLSGEGSFDGTWDAMYYAMLAVTLYHTHPSELEEFDVVLSYQTAELCYEKSIECLNAADFMKNHTIFAVQTICLLIYIGHNLGQSDRISVLLASASRIAQCLGLHRLGPDKAFYDNKPGISATKLIDREVSKRAWWFLVRQDWLQIPFNNTYSIHPTHFNTPMPNNCDEGVYSMVVENRVVDHEKDHYTQGSYTSVLNHVSVVIWKMQDKICQHKSPDDSEEDLHRLYSEVVEADRELRANMSKMPTFLKSGDSSSELPTHIEQQRAVLSLGLAHKFYSIHRHFQIPSLKDPSFAYTKVSCLPIMRRHLSTFLSLPNNTNTHIVTNLWTANTQVLTAALWLLFELIFSREESAQIYEAAEIRELASRSRQFLRRNEHKSRIAKRGVTLIESLLEIDQAVALGDQSQFSLQDIISRVVRSDQSTKPAVSEPFTAPLVDLVSGDGLSWEDIMDAFIET